MLAYITAEVLALPGGRPKNWLVEIAILAIVAGVVFVVGLIAALYTKVFGKEDEKPD